MIPWLDTTPSNYFRGTKEQSIYLSMTSVQPRLDVSVCFPARFMLKHLTGLLTTPTPEGAAACAPWTPEDALADELQEKFPLVVFSCLQLSSKLSLHSHVGSVTPTSITASSLHRGIISILFSKYFPDNRQQCCCALSALRWTQRVQADGPGVRAEGL